MCVFQEASSLTCRHVPAGPPRWGWMAPRANETERPTSFIVKVTKVKSRDQATFSLLDRCIDEIRNL